MAVESKGNLKKLDNKIEKLLAGERKSQIVCATPEISKILIQRYPIVLIKREVVNKKLGLYIYTVKRRDS